MGRLRWVNRRGGPNLSTLLTMLQIFPPANSPHHSCYWSDSPHTSQPPSQQVQISWHFGTFLYRLGHIYSGQRPWPQILREMGLWEVGLRRVGLRRVGLREVELRRVGLRRVGLRGVELWGVGLWGVKNQAELNSVHGRGHKITKLWVCGMVGRFIYSNKGKVAVLVAIVRENMVKLLYMYRRKTR